MGWFADNEVLIQQICIYMIVAASLQVVLNAGVFSLMAAGVWLVGAYAAAIGVREGAGAAVAIAVAILIGAAVALAMGLVTRRLTGLQLAMGTIAFVLMIGIGAKAGGDFTGGPLGLYGIPPLVSTATLIVAAVVVAVLLTLLERGRLGRMVDAIREDAHVAAAVGIPVERVQILLMTLGGALGALSGALYAFTFNAVSPELGGFTLVVLLLSMVVIGGISSWKGAYVGAAILIWLPDASSIFDDWSAAVYGLILIVVVVLAPGGVVGVARRLLQLVRRRGRSASAPEAAR